MFSTLGLFPFGSIKCLTNWEILDRYVVVFQKEMLPGTEKSALHSRWHMSVELLGDSGLCAGTAGAVHLEKGSSASR